MPIQQPQEETRTYDVVFECRAGDADNPTRISGHAAVFNQWVDLGWGFRERIIPGAFTTAIKRDDVRALFNHDPNFVLGRNKSGTLRMKEDDAGLWMEVDLPDTQLVRDMLIEPIRRGDITQQSFAFRVTKEEWRTFDDDKTKLDERDIKEVKLYDVSPVTYPAYEGTDVALACRSKSLEQIHADKTPVWRTKFLRRKLDLKTKGDIRL